MIAPNVSEPDRVRGGQEHPAGARRLELERLDAAVVEGVPVEQVERQLAQARRLAREDLDARVEDLGAGRLLEDRRSEAWRRPGLVDARVGLEPVELGEPLGLALELGERARAGVVLEDADRDRDRDERGHEHAREEDRGELEAQGAQHGPPL
jgi:hypothetical protein